MPIIYNDRPVYPYREDNARGEALEARWNHNRRIAIIERGQASHRRRTRVLLRLTGVRFARLFDALQSEVA
jgi:hypothetical protein